MTGARCSRQAREGRRRRADEARPRGARSRRRRRAADSRPARPAAARTRLTSPAPRAHRPEGTDAVESPLGRGAAAQTWTAPRATASWPSLASPRPAPGSRIAPCCEKASLEPIRARTGSKGAGDGALSPVDIVGPRVAPVLTSLPLVTLALRTAAPEHSCSRTFAPRPDRRLRSPPFRRAAARASTASRHST